LRTERLRLGSLISQLVGSNASANGARCGLPVIHQLFQRLEANQPHSAYFNGLQLTTADEGLDRADATVEQRSRALDPDTQRLDHGLRRTRRRVGLRGYFTGSAAPPLLGRRRRRSSVLTRMQIMD
jgi:hypothetical protein